MASVNQILLDYFTQCEDDQKYVICKTCNKKISRGSDLAHNANTSNLTGHLKIKSHRQVYEEYSKRREEYDKCVRESLAKNRSKVKILEQQKITSSFEKMQKWKPDDPKSIRLDNIVMEMIAIGNYPFTVVKEMGFNRLVNYLNPRAVLKSDKFYREKLLPTYEGVKNKIRILIDNAQYLSFTSDVWTNKASTTSLLSLTGHYINPEKGTRLKLVLAAAPLAENHTSGYLKDVLLKIISDYNIPSEKIHVLVHDNGNNITKAIHDANVFESARCLAHTLQLVIEDAIHTQRSVNDMLAKARNIVGYFNRSEQGRRYLKAIQLEVGAPQHQLIQSVVTRWNSTFEMLQRLVEQKEVLALYDLRHGLTDSISANEWKLAENCIKILQTFHSITKEISSDVASISMTIPIVRIISEQLQPLEEEGGVGTIRQVLLESMKKRFKDLENKKIYACATYLDPRFKGKFSLSETTRSMAVQWLKEEFDNQPVNIATEEVVPLPSTSSASIQKEEEVPTKRQKFDVWTYMQSVHESDKTNKRQTETDESILSLFEEEIKLFEIIRSTDECGPQMQTNIFDWWERSSFVILKKAARKYLSAPPTSVPSEQLFSTAGEIYDDNRYSLHSDTAEMLLFLNKNLPLINFDY